MPRLQCRRQGTDFIIRAKHLISALQGKITSHLRGGVGVVKVVSKWDGFSSTSSKSSKSKNYSNNPNQKYKLDKKIDRLVQKLLKKIKVTAKLIKGDINYYIVLLKHPKTLLLHLRTGVIIRYKKIMKVVKNLPYYAKHSPQLARYYGLKFQRFAMGLPEKAVRLVTNFPSNTKQFITNLPAKLKQFIKSLPTNTDQFFEDLKTSRTTRTKFALFCLTFVISVGAIIRILPGQKTAAWYNDAWTFRRKLTVNNPSSATTNKKIKFDISADSIIAEGKMQDDGGDIRVTDTNGNLLPYYYDETGGVTGTPGEDILRDGSGPDIIDNTGDIGALPENGRQIVQTSTGTLYSFVNDGGSCEVWMSITGKTWEEQDSSNNPACSSSQGIALAIDGSDDLHLMYEITGLIVTYNTFDTASNTFGGSPETIFNSSWDGVSKFDIAIDNNDVPHIVFYEIFYTGDDTFYYSNRVGGSWLGTPVAIEYRAFTVYSASIVINEDNIPEISYSTDDDDLTAGVGDDNDPDTAGQWTLYDVDTDVSGGFSPPQRGCSMAIDQAGNTWIAYIDEDGTDDYVNLALHTDGSGWTTWETPIETTNVGYEPSIAVISSDIYVFYNDDSTDSKIVYNKYNLEDAAWSGETALQTPSSGVDFQDVHVRWSNYNNNEGYIIDYLFSDGTDVYWDYFDARPVEIEEVERVATSASGLGSQGRSIFRTPSGELYAVLRDSYFSTTVEVWRSEDGTTWEEQDSGNSLPVTAPTGGYDAAIDTNGVLHIVYVDDSINPDLDYVTFSTATNTYGSSELIANGATDTYYQSTAIAIDSSNIPHVSYERSTTSGSRIVKYANRVGGSPWSSIEIEGSDAWTTSIAINKDDEPVIVYDTVNDDTLTAAIGDSNDATSFTLQDVDTSVWDNNGSQSGGSLGIDHEGNTWVSYIDADNDVALAKNNYGDPWTSWTTYTDKTNNGYRTSLAINNSDIYVFYEAQDAGVADTPAYDVFDSSPDSLSWEGETILDSNENALGMSVKYSTHANHFGSNRLDFLYATSGGTDAQWSSLHLRRMPNKIDDGSDFGTPYPTGRNIVRTSSGTLYSVSTDDGGGPLEVWKSVDDGNTWSEQDSGDKPTAASNVAVAIDNSNDTLHIAYSDAALPSDVDYITFTTTDDQFVTPSETIYDAATVNALFLSMAVDSNNIPHVAFYEDSASNYVRYYNRVGGSWGLTPVETVTNASLTDITINEDNKPEIAYINVTDGDLTLAEGDANDPSTFTLTDVDTDVVTTNGTAKTSLAIDASGNTWVSYIDNNGTADYVSLAYHPDGSAWASDWTTYDNDNLGYEPSIAAVGNNIYVFYEDDNDYIVYDKFSGSEFAGEEVLEQNSPLSDVNAKWSYYNNYDSLGLDGTGDNSQSEIDYFYSDGTDTWYNRLTLSTETYECTGACLWILPDKIPAGDSNYYMYYGNPSASNGSETSNFSQEELGTYTYNEFSEEIGPGPTMILRFDEGHGTQAHDSTLYKNHATISAGNPVYPTVEKQINIIDQIYGTAGGGDPGDNSLGLIYWDADAYSGEQVYFEAIMKCDSCTGGGNNEVDVVLANDVGTTLPSSIISTSSSSYTRVRTSSLITLTDNEEYTIEVTRDDDTGTAYVKAARLVIVQSGTDLTATETQIELGMETSTTSDVAVVLSAPKIYEYDHDAYNDGTIDSFFEATIKSSTAPGANLNVGTTYPTTITTYQDATNGYDDNDWDTPGNAGSDDGNYAFVDPPQFDAPDYSYVLRTSNFPFSASVPNDATIKGVEVTIERYYANGTVSDALVQLVNNSAGDETDRIGNNLSVGTTFPSTDGTGVFGSSTDTWGASLTPAIVNSSSFGLDYAMQATGANADGFIDYIRMDVWYQEASVTGTAYAELYNITNSQTVDTVSVNSTDWTRVRGSALSTNWDEISDDEYQVRLYASNTAHTTYISNAKIVTQQTKDSTITNTESVLQYNPLLTSYTGDSYASIDYTNNFNADNYDNGTFEAFFESTLNTSNGSNAYYGRLDYGGGIGEITGTDTSYTRKESSDLWSNLPSSGTSDTDVELRNASAGTTTSNAGSILKIQGSSIETTPAPDPSWQQPEMCVAGGCLYYDGTDDTATVSSADYIDLSDHLTDGFTYSFWVKPMSGGESEKSEIFQKGTNTYAAVVNEGSGDATYIDLQVSVDLASSDAVGTFTDALKLYEWNHVAIAYTDDVGDEATIYVDGVSIGSTSGGSGAPATDTNDLVIGGSSSNNLHGYIDEFMIHPKELDADTIESIHYSGAKGLLSSKRGSSTVLGVQDLGYLSRGLVGYWKLDESSGNATDSSGLNNTLANNGTTTFTPAKFGNGSEHVPASTQYFSAPSTINDVKTVSFWVNPDNTTNYYLQLTGSAYITSSSGTLSAVGFDNPTIYVNGVETDTIEADKWQLVTVTTDTAIDATQFYLGRQGSNYFDGTFDEVRFYTVALKLFEVKDLYEWSPGPIAKWKFDENQGTSSVYDSSGNDHTLTFDNVSDDGWVPGKYGGALYLNSQAVEGDQKLEQQINITTGSGKIAPANTTDGIVKIDTGSITGGTYYFEVVAKVDSGSGTAELTYNAGTGSTASGGSTITISGITSTEYERYRSASFSPTGDQNAYISDLTGTGATIRAARIIIEQSAVTITDTETQIELGCSSARSVETYFSCSESILKYYFDSSQFSPTPTVYFEASLRNTVGGESGYAELYNTTDGESVTNSEVSITGTTMGIARSGALTIGSDAGDLKTGKEYIVRIKSSSTDQMQIRNAKLIFDQSDGSGITSTEILHYYRTYKVSNLSTSWASDLYPNKYDPDKWGGGTVSNYFEVFLEGKIYIPPTPNDFGYSRLFNSSDTTPILNSDVSNDEYLHTGGYRERSEDISSSLPTSAKNLDSQYKCDTMGSCSIFSSRLVTLIDFGGSQSQDSLYVLDNPDLDFSTSQSFTIESWFKHNTQASGQNVLISKYETTGGDGGYKILMESDGDITCGVDNDNSSFPLDSVTSTSANFDDDRWHHVACVKNGSSALKLYLDGELVDTDSSLTTSGTYANDDSLYIGREENQTSTVWSGAVDETQIYNYARTSQQIVSDMNAGHPAPGSPVGSALVHWQFDEGYGSTTYDSGTNGNDGSLAVGDSSPSWTLNGQFDRALEYDGNDDYVDMGDILDLGDSDDQTISGWFYRDTASSDDTIIAKRDGITAGDTGYIVYIDDANDTLIYEISDGTDEYQLESTTTFTSTGWNHFAIVWDEDSSSDTKLYVNGDDDSATTTGTISNVGAVNGGDLRIGTESDGGNPFDGKIDEIRIYNSALNSDQIALLSNNGVSVRFGAAGTDASGEPSNDADRSYCWPDSTKDSCGPVVEYKLDENKGSYVYDTSINSNTGSLGTGDSSPSWDAVGKISGALNFDGTNDYVSISDDSSLSFSSTSDTFMISTWIYARDLSGEHTIFSKYDAANNLVEYSFDTTGDELTVVIDDDGNPTGEYSETTSSANLLTDRWYHVAAIISMQDDYINFYVNGILQSDTTSGSFPTDLSDLAEPARIGTKTCSGGSLCNFWEGRIDNLRVYDYGVPKLALWDQNRGGPHGWYKLDECEGAVAYDSAGYGNSGTITIGTDGTNSSTGTCSSGDSSEAWNNGTTGKRNYSLDFDGSDDYINIGNPSSGIFDFGNKTVSTGSDFSFAAWIKTSGDSEIQTILEKRETSGSKGYALYVNTNGTVEAYLHDGTDSVTATTTNSVDDSSWHHVAATFDRSGNANIYIDGVLDTNSTTDISTDIDDLSNGGSLIIGDGNYNNTGSSLKEFYGQLDDIRIFRHILEQQEILTVMNDGAIRFGPTTGEP